LCNEIYKKIELQKALDAGGRDEFEAVRHSQMEKDPKNCLQICRFYDHITMMKDVDVNESGKVEKPNPIVDKFYIMTREDSVSASQIKPTTG
jgi:hypothetical protein